MLAELAAANAADATISKFIANGKEISDALALLKKLGWRRGRIKSAGKSKKNGLFYKVMCKSADDFDEFLALQQISEKRRELESLCRLYAKLGTWDKFIEFKAKMCVQRKKEAEATQRQIAPTIHHISCGLIAALRIGDFALLYFFAEFLRGLK